VLVDQAAHQPPADPGELRRVERQLLVFRHLDRDRLEVAQEGRAAQLLAARADAANRARLVAHPDLAHLDARAEFVRQVLDKIPEVDPAVRVK